MSLYDDARLLDSVCYDLVLGDYPRGQNRALINNLANGEPPYSEEEVKENGIEVNVNDLTHCCKMHDGRTQFQSALLKTGTEIVAKTDWPAIHRRADISAIVTDEIKKPMRRSIQWFERQRAKAGQIILHGIAPGVWENEDKWCTKPLGVEDVLIPSNTLLGFDNLPVYVLRRQFTSMELLKLTEKPKIDPGWNRGMLERIRKWLDSQLVTLRNVNWPDVWAPEKVAERVKQDTGYYLGDQVPTIDCFDIYGYVNDGKKSGWVRRIILDSWGQPQQSGGGYTMSRRNDGKAGDDDLYRSFAKNDFLYTSRDRIVYDDWQQSIAFQFADLSAVFPAYYHSVRSLGWLLYASCHVSMRMRCKFWEAIFEALMQQFKVQNMDDAQRALKMNLVNRGFIDETLKPIPAGERWQVNSNLVELGLQDVQGVITENSSSFVQNRNFSQDRTEKTKFQVMAELNTVTSLVSAAINQAYMYEVFEDREIFRRFMRKNSQDLDVRRARSNMLKRGVPEKYLVAEAFEIDRERTMGAGNKTMEMQIAGWLMEQRDKYDPQSQRIILRDATLAVTDNPDKAEELVPMQQEPSDSLHDAQVAAATLMLGMPMAFKDGVNHQEYAAALIGALNSEVQRAMQQGLATPEKLEGMQNLAGVDLNGKPIQGNGATAHINALTSKQDQPVKKNLATILGRQMNEVKGLAQRLHQAMQKQQQQNGNGQMDPKDMAKVQAMQLQAQTKAQIAERSAAQRTAQKQVMFEQQMRQERQKHQADLGIKHREHVANLAGQDLESASAIRRNKLSSTEE